MRMNRSFPTGRLLLALTLLLSAPATWAATDAAAGAKDQPLEPSARQTFVEQLSANLLSRYHFADKELDDSLSARILDRYIRMLDGNRSYFLASDIARFEQYRHKLDDALKKGDLEPAFAIYRVYEKRLHERLQFALTQLESKPDFTLDEDFRFDRSEAPWAQTEAQLDDLWRKRVKNDAIGLLLTGKSWEETRKLLEERYCNYLRRSDQIESGDVFEVFMNAYAQTLDPHTMYMSPHDSEEFEIRMSLTYEGIGAALQTENEYVKIARILPGGSAAASGALKPNDRITAVAQGKDGEWKDVIGWRLEDVVDLIRGPADTLVRLQILPAGMPPGSPPKSIKLVRSEIQLEEQAAQSKVIDIERDGKNYRVGVISIPAFYMDYEARMQGKQDYRSTTRDVRKLIDELQQKNIDGLVIDLRDNGGGSLPEAVELTGLFIDDGPVVQVKSSDGQLEVLDDPNAGTAYSGPLAVVVNRFSASASEIFAGAIQDYGRGVVIGSNTYGKGTVQNLWELSRFLKTDAELGQIKMTIGKFYRVTGSSTQHKGVQPDITLPSAIDDSEFGESTEPSALPWDRIGTADAAQKRLHELPNVEALAALHAQRVAQGESFRLLQEDIAQYREAAGRKVVSLNLAERRKQVDREQQQALRRENAWRASNGLAPLESLEQAAAENDSPDQRSLQEDVWLQESAQILVDQIKLNNGSSRQSLAAAQSS